MSDERRPLLLGELSWPEAEDLVGATLVVPVGSCEQHGPHLPLDTDTRIAQALADRLAAARPEVLVAPAMGVGASGEHAGFPGTLSLGTEALTTALAELVRSAGWARGVVLVNGHGGNVDALRAARRTLLDEGRQLLVWGPALPGDAHAGRTETSLLLAIAPESVGPERPVGRTEPVAQLLDELRASGVAAVSPSGVLGDARGANAEEGHRLLDAAAADLLDAYDRWAAVT